MFRPSLHRQAVALWLLCHALRTEGVQLHRTIEELKENDSLALDLVDAQTKQNLTSLKSKSLQMITFGKDSSSWDEPYFAVHQTTSGGRDDNYYGLHVTMDVYGHKLNPGQWSSTGIWVNNAGDGVKSSYNAISVGWHIYPDHYGNSHTHLYTYWTRDGYNKTGCLNMDCPGFVRADGAHIAPGDIIHQVSDVSDGRVQTITLRVLKDKTSGDWWVYYGVNSIPTGVGYFPRSLFTYLGEKATQVAFGAFVVAERTLPTPPMGSGALPDGRHGRAAFLTNLKFIDQDGNSSPIITDIPKLVTKDKCHSITPIDHAGCLYGGPSGCLR